MGGTQEMPSVKPPEQRKMCFRPHSTNSYSPRKEQTFSLMDCSLWAESTEAGKRCKRERAEEINYNMMTVLLSPPPHITLLCNAEHAKGVDFALIFDFSSYYQNIF